MGVELGSAHGKIVIDGSGVETGVRQAKNALGGLQQSFAGVGSIIKGVLGAQIIQKTFTAVRDGILSAKDAASDMNETFNKVDTVFGAASDQIQKFAENADTALGQSKQAALDAASTFGVFGKAASLSGPDLASFSTTLTGLSSDLASFYNTSPEEAVIALGAALRGESEPIRKYGVLLDDATLRQKAMEMGLIKTTKQALTPAQKVLASYNVILDQTKDAQGDFARTSDGLANSQRIQAAQTQNLKTMVGQALLPAFQAYTNVMTQRVLPAATRFVSDFITPAVPAISGFIDKLSGGGSLSDAFRAAGSALEDSFPGASQVLKNVGDAITTVKREAQNLYNLLINGDFTGLFGLEEDDPIIDTILNVRDKIVLIGEAWPGVRDKITEAVGVVREKAALLAEAWPGVRDKIVNAFLVAKGYVDKFKASLAAFDGNIVAGIADFATKLGFEGVGAKILEFSATVQNGLAQARATILNFVTAVAGWWNEHGNTVIAVILTAWKVVKSIVIAAVNALRPAITKFINGIKSGFAGIGPVIEAFKTLWNTLAPVLGVLLAAVGAIMLAIVGLMVGGFNAIAAAIGPFIAMLLGVVQGVVTVVTGIINVVSGFVMLLVGLFTGNAALIQQSWAQMGLGITQIFQGLVTTIVALVTGLWTTITTLIGGLVTGVITFFQNLYMELVGGSIIPDLVRMILEWFVKLATDVVTSIRTFISNIVDTIRGSISTMQAIGEELINGLKTGIENKVNEVLEWLMGKWEQIINLTHRIFRVDSPSKVFWKIGGFIGEGFKGGLAESLAGAQQVIQNLVGSMSTVVAPTPAFASAGAGGGYTDARTANLYANSDVDMEAWQKRTLDDVRYRQKRY